MRSLAKYVLLLVVSGGFLSGPAQESSQVAQVPTMWQVLKMPGRLIAQGVNKTPGEHWNLTSYRVEEVQLPAWSKTMVRGQQIETSTAWRVTLTGGPFPVRDMPAVIWAGDISLGVAHENFDRSQLTAITYDREGLRTATKLYLSYGFSKENRAELPEEVNFGGVL